jgi:hypothetical protein
VTRAAFDKIPEVLLAEVHGHGSRDLADNEDYLTSAVFGHLRYIRPALFWSALFSRAVGIPVNGKEQPLLEFLKAECIEVSEFSRLDAYFWPSHEIFGTPDLILCFSAEGRAPLVVVCEAKLWAGKSGVDEHDQLLRYLKLLRSLESVRPRLNVLEHGKVTVALLYITPRDSLGEVLETAALCSQQPDLIKLLYRVQWQDVTDAADESQPQADRLDRLLLSDLSSFLKRRGLEYFRGFCPPSVLALDESEAHFYGSTGTFIGFESGNSGVSDPLSDHYYDSPGCDLIPSRDSSSADRSRHRGAVNNLTGNGAAFSGFETPIVPREIEFIGSFYRKN